jgi:hypothetical protein
MRQNGKLEIFGEVDFVRTRSDGGIGDILQRGKKSGLRAILVDACVGGIERKPKRDDAGGGQAMADYTFDGKRLKSRSGQKIGEIDRNLVRAYNGAKFGEIEGKNIRDAHGKKVLEFDGRIIRDDMGKKISIIDDIRKLIEGEASISVVALWYFFIKK